MGQTEVLNVLKEDDWMTSKQLAEILKQSQGLVNRSLKSLFKQREIKRKQQINSIRTCYLWQKV